MFPQPPRLVVQALKMPSDAMCAYCRRHPVDPDWRPFCSERCRMADLGSWISGDYRAPGDPPPPADSEGTEDDDRDG